MFVDVPKCILLKFFSEDCNLTHDELELLKNHMVKFCNETIMFWNPDLRKIVESVRCATTAKELKEINMNLVCKGVDCF